MRTIPVVRIQQNTEKVRKLHGKMRSVLMHLLLHMSMQDWVDQTNQFLSNNRRKVLEGKGRISHEQAIEKATKEYGYFPCATGSRICIRI